MATFRAYAKVLEPSDPAMRLHEAGLRGCPGQPGPLLADVLRPTGGVYETMTPLTPQLRADIRAVAELTSDAELLAVADLTEVPVSLAHLRGLDPQTRIIIRKELCYEADEGARVSREHRPGLATILADEYFLQPELSCRDGPDPVPRRAGLVCPRVSDIVVAAMR